MEQGHKYIDKQKVADDAFEPMFKFITDDLTPEVIKEIQNINNCFETNLYKIYMFDYKPSEPPNYIVGRKIDIVVCEADWSDGTIKYAVDPYIESLGGKQEDDVDLNVWDELPDIVGKMCAKYLSEHFEEYLDKDVYDALKKKTDMHMGNLMFQ